MAESVSECVCLAQLCHIHGPKCWCFAVFCFTSAFAGDLLLMSVSAWRRLLCKQEVLGSNPMKVQG
jgi:hypothetical protein